jgi:hypothetical protein
MVLLFFLTMIAMQPVAATGNYKFREAIFSATPFLSSKTS